MTHIPHHVIDATLNRLHDRCPVAVEILALTLAGVAYGLGYVLAAFIAGTAIAVVTVATLVGAGHVLGAVLPASGATVTGAIAVIAAFALLAGLAAAGEHVTRHA